MISKGSLVKFKHLFPGQVFLVLSDTYTFYKWIEPPDAFSGKRGPAQVVDILTDHGELTMISVRELEKIQ